MESPLYENRLYSRHRAWNRRFWFFVLAWGQTLSGHFLDTMPRRAQAG